MVLPSFFIIHCYKSMSNDLMIQMVWPSGGSPTNLDPIRCIQVYILPCLEILRLTVELTVLAFKRFIFNLQLWLRKINFTDMAIIQIQFVNDFSTSLRLAIVFSVNFCPFSFLLTLKISIQLMYLSYSYEFSR